MKKISFRPAFFALPYVVICAIFVVFPLILVLIYAFIGADGSFTFENFKLVFTQSSNLTLLLKTIGIAALTTVICLLIAYPTAMVLASAPFNRYVVLALLFIIPMWMNFVLRVIALKSLLFMLGVDYGFLATMIGMVYASAVHGRSGKRNYDGVYARIQRLCDNGYAGRRVHKRYRRQD